MTTRNSGDGRGVGTDPKSHSDSSGIIMYASKAFRWIKQKTSLIGQSIPKFSFVYRTTFYLFFLNGHNGEGYVAPLTSVKSLDKCLNTCPNTWSHVVPESLQHFRKMDTRTSPYLSLGNRLGSLDVRNPIPSGLMYAPEPISVSQRRLVLTDSLPVTYPWGAGVEDSHGE